jgi:hypothetical protein
MQFTLRSYFVVVSSIVVGIATPALMYELPPRDWPSPIGFQPFLLFGVFILPLTQLFALTIQAIVLINNRLIALPLTHATLCMQGTIVSLWYYREHPGGYRVYGDFDPERHLLLLTTLLLFQWAGVRFCGWKTDSKLQMCMAFNTTVAYLLWYSLDLWSTI